MKALGLLEKVSPPALIAIDITGFGGRGDVYSGSYRPYNYLVKITLKVMGSYSFKLVEDQHCLNHLAVLDAVLMNFNKNALTTGV